MNKTSISIIFSILSILNLNSKQNDFNNELYGTSILYSENDLWVGKIEDTFSDKKTCFIGTDKKINFVYWFFNDNEYLTFSDKNIYSIKNVKIRFDKDNVINYEFDNENSLNLIQDINNKFKSKNEILFESNYNNLLYREKIDLSNFNKIYDIAKKCESLNYYKELNNIHPISLNYEFEKLNYNIYLNIINNDLKNFSDSHKELSILYEKQTNKIREEMERKFKEHNREYLKKEFDKLHLKNQDKIKDLKNMILDMENNIKNLNIDDKLKNNFLNKLNKIKAIDGFTFR